MVNKVCQCGVGQRPKCFIRRPTLAQQDVFVKQFLHLGNKLDPKIGSEYVSGCDEELLPKVGYLVRADGEEGQHTLHHQARVGRHLLLVDPEQIIEDKLTSTKFHIQLLLVRRVSFTGTGKKFKTKIKLGVLQSWLKP